MNCIVLDQGNTSIKWGLFTNGILEDSGRFLDPVFEAELMNLQANYQVPFFYSSVRSKAEQTKFLNQFSFCKLISKEKFPSYRYTNGVAGKDRLANVSGAFHILGAKESLIVDFGTCITYSIAHNNTLVSGVISLGAQSRLNAMHEYTGQLPLIKFAASSKPFENSTEGAMQSSINFGILSELKGFIEEAKHQFPQIEIVFTGTDAVHFAKQLNYRIFVELNLTLIGLYVICCANEP